ncbi:MAG: sulfatase [Planctomycetota bacterium]
MNVVLVVADSLRADALGAYGGAVATPTLDRLAAEGARAETAFSAAPWTLPSLAAMLTGAYPHRVGLIHWRQPWPASRPTIFERFRDAGFETASFVFNPDYLFTGLCAAGVRGASTDEEKMFSWIAGQPAKNRFLFLHYWGTHFPYVAKTMAPGAWKAASDGVLAAMNEDPAHREKVRAMYRLAVARFSEAWLPRLLEALAPAGETLLAVAADHGEVWGERKGEGEPIRGVFDLHGNSLHEESLRIPLILHAPRRIPPGVRVSGLVRTVDIGPTLLELAGVGGGLSPDADGVSLARVFRQGGTAGTRTSLAVGTRKLHQILDGEVVPLEPDSVWDRWSLRTADRKWIWEPAENRRRVYDLAADPAERFPLDGGAADAFGWEILESERKRSRLEPVAGDIIERERRRARTEGT